jgi:hypothetical protein
MCLDWILASTEYIEFVYMMLEFKVYFTVSIFRGLKTGMERTTNTMLVKPTNMAERMRKTTKLENMRESTSA